MPNETEPKSIEEVAQLFRQGKQREAIVEVLPPSYFAMLHPAIIQAFIERVATSDNIENELSLLNNEFDRMTMQGNTNPTNN